MEDTPNPIPHTIKPKKGPSKPAPVIRGRFSRWEKEGGMIGISAFGWCVGAIVQLFRGDDPIPAFTLAVIFAAWYDVTRAKGGEP